MNPPANNALATRPTSTALGHPAVFMFSPESRQIIKDMFAREASDTEFATLVTVAETRGLDPRLGHCHFVKRWDSKLNRSVWAVQISIDGMRMYAERSGDYDGQDEPEWIVEGGEVIGAKLRVYRKSINRAFVGVAYFDEYVQTDRDGNPTKFWVKMRRTMLAKCAEALAHRKAFPQLAQLYTPEEMMQAENDAASAPGTGRFVHASPEAVRRERETSPAIAAMKESIDELGEGLALEQLVAIWIDHRPAIWTESGGDSTVIEAAQHELLSRSPVPTSPGEFNWRVRIEEACAKHPPMKELRAALVASTAPAAVVDAWRAHRKAIVAIDEVVRKLAWEMSYRRAGALDTNQRQPGKWLKAEVEAADARAAAEAKAAAEKPTATSEPLTPADDDAPPAREDDGRADDAVEAHFAKKSKPEGGQ